MPPRPVPPLDKLGFVLFGSGLAVLTFSMSMISESNVTVTQVVTTFVIALLLLGGYIKHSYRRKHPIVKIELLQTRTFCVSVLGNLLPRLGFGVVPFLLPLLFQIGLGYSPRLSGILLAPIAVGVFLVKPLSFYILRQFGYKNLLILNTVLVSISLWSFFPLTNIHQFMALGF